MRQPPPSFQSRSDIGLEGIKVKLWDPPHSAMDAARVIASFYISTWGDPVDPMEWSEDDAWGHAQNAMEGRTLPNTLEVVPLTFSVTGISRATTHQLVRSRVGAVFGQQGGRDNNWHNFNWRLPSTIADNHRAVQKIRTFHIYLNQLYQELTDSGVPFQDARYVLPMGLETSLVTGYNLLSFKGLADRRLCNRMMWETNYVVRLMADEVVKHYPFVGRSLRSGCEKRGQCASVSPMFPPSCWYYERTVMEARLASDNRTLEVEAEGRYDFPVKANGNWRHFSGIDEQRVTQEGKEPGMTWSLLDPKTPLARKDVEGFWDGI